MSADPLANMLARLVASDDSLVSEWARELLRDSDVQPHPRCSSDTQVMYSSSADDHTAARAG